MKLLTMVIWALSTLTPMAPAEPTSKREIHGETPEDFAKNIRLLTEAIGKTKAVTLLEGLPHQYYEEESLAKELKEKKTVKLHGFPFYEGAIAVSEKEAKLLRDVCSDLKSFKRFEIPAACGGFHPDWCVEFAFDKEVYRVLVCFGCHEARLYGPKNDVYTVLDDEQTYKQLVAVLKPHQKQRPKRAPAKQPVADPFGSLSPQDLIVDPFVEPQTKPKLLLTDPIIDFTIIK